MYNWCGCICYISLLFRWFLACLTLLKKATFALTTAVLSKNKKNLNEISCQLKVKAKRCEVSSCKTAQMCNKSKIAREMLTAEKKPPSGREGKMCGRAGASSFEVVASCARLFLFHFVMAGVFKVRRYKKAMCGIL